MSRFDPNTYPDRFAFEAHVRRIRTRELDELFHAAGARVRVWQHDFAYQLSKFAAAHSHTQAPSS
jgi:hypothetical protein